MGKNNYSKKECDKHYQRILNAKYGFNDKYKLSYLTPSEFNIIDNSIFFLRKMKYFDGHTSIIIRKIFKHHAENYHKINHLISQDPRKHAQLFIGKKKIREFIFRRDNYQCLCCGNTTNLSIDHIIPVFNGGKDRLGNLQTLCKSCNSRKSTTYIDYR